jgi:NAD(P)-dependent dehydrogenase (short-subunit alcohol dehydrogenase family)
MKNGVMQKNNMYLPGCWLSVCSMDLLRKIFDTNYFRTIHTTQQFLSLLQRSEAPAIINVSSESGSLSMLTNP